MQKNTIIIYGSQYGTAKRYAEELGRHTGVTVKDYTEITGLERYDTIVYIGALYAGGVLGMKKTFQNLKDTRKRIIIATVGLADPTDEENVSNIRSGMKKQLSPEIYEKARICHLRGAIDYSKLNFKHKTMMHMLYKKAKNLPEEKKTPEVRAMLETYGKQVSFVDFSVLEKMMRAE